MDVTAVASADVTSGTEPLTVNFDSAGSFDPEGKTLYFIWDSGDGSAVEKTSAATHTYEVPGQYTAALTVADDLGQNSIHTIEISVTAADEHQTGGLEGIFYIIPNQQGGAAVIYLE